MARGWVGESGNGCEFTRLIATVAGGDSSIGAAAAAAVACGCGAAAGVSCAPRACVPKTRRSTSPWSQQRRPRRLRLRISARALRRGPFLVLCGRPPAFRRITTARRLPRKAKGGQVGMRAGWKRPRNGSVLFVEGSAGVLVARFAVGGARMLAHAVSAPGQGVTWKPLWTPC